MFKCAYTQGSKVTWFEEICRPLILNAKPHSCVTSKYNEILCSDGVRKSIDFIRSMGYIINKNT